MGDETSAFVSWLQEQMSERGWSIRETARRAGVSHPRIADIINLQQTPSFDTCRRIAKVFGLDTQEVMRHAGILPPTKPKTERIARIIAVIEELSEDEQDFLEEWARLRIQHQQRKGRRREKAPETAKTT